MKLKHIVLIFVSFLMFTLNSSRLLKGDSCILSDEEVTFPDSDIIVTYSRYSIPMVHEDVIRYEYMKKEDVSNVKSYERRFIIEDKKGKKMKLKRHKHSHSKTSSSRRVASVVRKPNITVHKKDMNNQDIMQYAQDAPAPLDLMLYAQEMVNKTKGTDVPSSFVNRNDKNGRKKKKRKKKKKKKRKRKKRDVVRQEMKNLNVPSYLWRVQREEDADDTRAKMLEEKYNNLSVSVKPRTIRPSRNTVFHRHKTTDKRKTRWQKLRAVRNAIKANIALLRRQNDMPETSPVIGDVLHTDIKLLRHFEQYIVSNKRRRSKVHGKKGRKKMYHKEKGKNGTIVCFKFSVLPEKVIHTMGWKVKLKEFKIVIGSPKQNKLPSCTVKKKRTYQPHSQLSSKTLSVHRGRRKKRMRHRLLYKHKKFSTLRKRGKRRRSLKQREHIRQKTFQRSLAKLLQEIHRNIEKGQDSSVCVDVKS